MCSSDLAVAKRDTLNRLLSNALNNNKVCSHEFDTILSEFQQYNFLKDQVQARMLRQPSTRKLPDVDIKKMEEDIRSRVEAEMIKKNHKPSRFELTFRNRRFHLHVIRTWLSASTWSRFWLMSILHLSGKKRLVITREVIAAMVEADEVF